MHLIDKHLFPKDYDFYVVNHGIGNRCFMLKSWNQRIDNSSDVNHSSVNKQQSYLDTETKKASAAALISTKNSEEDLNLNGLSSAMSALRFVPPSVREKLATKKNKGI